jgi:catechol 2,3-dioxygenase-like lactoylglutathione lyase family enzyme
MTRWIIVAALAALAAWSSAAWSPVAWAQAPAGTPADTEVREILPRAKLDNAAPNPVQPGQALAPMARATIFVRDLEASLKLYRDILGLKPMFDNHWKGKGINAIMGTEGKELRATVLMAGESVVGNIGLYQLSNEKGAPPPPRGTDTRTGDFAVIFPTNDIWGLTRKIEAAGYEIVSPPVTLLARPGMKQQPLEMMFRDPDGVLVNLVQAGVPE